MVKAFILSNNEMKSYNNFLLKHQESCDGLISISFTYSTWGNVVLVDCSCCGEILDITDMDKF